MLRVQSVGYAVFSLHSRASSSQIKRITCLRLVPICTAAISSTDWCLSNDSRGNFSSISDCMRTSFPSGNSSLTFRAVAFPLFHIFSRCLLLPSFTNVALKSACLSPSTSPFSFSSSKFVSSFWPSIRDFCFSLKRPVRHVAYPDKMRAKHAIISPAPKFIDTILS